MTNEGELTLPVPYRERVRTRSRTFEAATSRLTTAVEEARIGSLSDALDGLAEATGRATDVLAREGGADDKILLFRAAILLRTCRPPRPRIVPTMTAEEYASAPGM